MAENQDVAVNEQTGEIMEAPQKLVFGTNDPKAIIARAQAVADQLKDIVEKQHLFFDIKGKKHVTAEGWTTMAAMLGVFPQTAYAQRLERNEETAYEAKVILRHISGAEVGAGEAVCSSKERNWSGRDEYAVKSMAQTRALGKACRLSFSWIMALAGYQVTPLEEMPAEGKTLVMPRSKQDIERIVESVDRSPDEAIEFGDAPPPEHQEAIEKVQQIMGKPKTLSVAQQKLLFYKMNQAKCPEPALKTFIKQHFGKNHSADMTSRELDETIDWLAKLESLPNAPA